MKIIYNTFEIELLSCSIVNNYYNIRFSIKLKNEVTDTDFCFCFTTKFNERDLQYISDNFFDIINNAISSFGFKSCDQSLSLHFELSNDGMINQFEIWKFFSVNTYYTYSINMKTDIFFLEQLCDMFNYIKMCGFTDKTDFKLENSAPLLIEILKNIESNNYSLCLNFSENRIIRKNCLQQEDFDYLRSQITMLLGGEILSIKIESENLFLSITSFGSDFMVDGEISDFTFPFSNKLKMSGGYPLERDALYKIIQ